MSYGYARPRRRSNPVLRVIITLLILGGIAFFVYRAQMDTVISVGTHPTIIVEDCLGFVHVHAGPVNNEVILQGPWTLFTSYSQDKASNTVNINGCDLNIAVPANTDVKINADSIDVTGVSGQMSLTTNGGSITMQQDTLQGQSTLDNNGGPIRFSGSLDPRGTSKFSSNGGLIDITLTSSPSFHLDVTGILNTVTTDFPGIQVQSDEVHANVGQPPYATLSLQVNDSPIVLHKGS
jgi:hypothetical protein